MIPAQDLIDRRTRVLGPAYRLFYDHPLYLVRGRGATVWDADGREYIDAYNNVPSVGHCHPRVVAALSAQAGALNTHTRYLHDAVIDYAEALAATFPDPLSQVILTCTGSEANDLALRIAWSVSGSRGVIVTDNAYHGVTASLAEISPSLGPAHRGLSGGLFIADEVQAGLARSGKHMWAFQRHDVVPDLVTLGKPLGGGHPLAGLVAQPRHLDAFGRATRYFNTFGGNPVSCATGLAVLDVIEQEGLQANAAAVGEHLLQGQRELVARHAIVGDARGAGLFSGIELVRDRTSREPADTEASYVANRLRERGLLLSTDGPVHNVLNIKPPLCFSLADADRLVTELDAVLGEDLPR